MLEIILIALLILLLAILYFGKKPSHLHVKQSRSSIGGLVGRMEGGTIKDSHYKGKIKIRGSPEQTDVGGLVGSMSKGSSVESSSSDTDIEFIAETIDDILYNRPLKLWVLGGFFVFVFLCIVVTIYYLQSSISLWRIATIYILSYFAYIVVTANILKFFSKIRDESFVTLLVMASSKLPKSLKFLLKYFR